VVKLRKRPDGQEIHVFELNLQFSQGDEQDLQILSETSPQNPEGHSSLQEFEDERNLGDSQVVQFLSDPEQVLQDGSQVLHCLREGLPSKEFI
jgi:hypothetical protein